MKRRDFLAASIALPLAGCKVGEFSFEQGLYNECRTTSPVLSHPFVAAAWQGLRADRVWDTHAHVFGNGRSRRGLWVNQDFDEPKNPLKYIRRLMFVNGGCAGKDEPALDAAAIDRMVHLADQLPQGAKLVLLGFDYVHDPDGRRREDISTFYVPPAYLQAIVARRPDRFEWAASIHPYRDDAVAAVEAAKAGGARLVKWLPPSMGIDPRHPKCRPFYDAMAKAGLPLLVHVGEERAVPGAELHDMGNPLFLRHALERGVRVIAAHCASLGTSPDLDADKNPAKAPAVENFELFARLMGERAHEKLLMADISAITQVNRAKYVPRILERAEWHPRLLNGSDYPLPGILPLFSVDHYVKAGLIEEGAKDVLKELRQVNALQFDFVLKRSLRWKGARLADGVFETRDKILGSDPNFLTRHEARTEIGV